MKYLVDPDVLRASFDDFSCMAALNKIITEVQVHRFFRDIEATIELEYRRIFNEYFDNDEHPAIRLLQFILFEDGNSEDRISGYCTVRDEIEQENRLFPVEPDMIGMVANALSVGLILVLVGRDNVRGTRPRRLNDSEFYRTVGKKVPWLEVKWAGSTRVEIPHAIYQPTDVSAAKTREFEPKAALWLQDNDCNLRCITPPPKGRIDGEEIDVYGYRCSSAETTAVIGECKLRREGNEAAKPIERSEIQQLRRKLMAARSYERARKRKPSDMSTPTKYEGILVSNANEVTDEARLLAAADSEFTLKVLRVELTKRWETRQDWKILSGSITFTNLPS